MSDPYLFDDLSEWSYIKLSDIPSELYVDADPIDPLYITWLDSEHHVSICSVFASYDVETRRIVYIVDGRRRLAAIAAERGDAETLVNVYQTPYMGPEEKVRRVELNKWDRIDICGIVFDLVRQFGYEKVARMIGTSEAKVSTMADGYIREVGTANAFA